MDPWAFISILLLNCLVSASVGWMMAGLRFGMLAARVAEMEAAVEHYWDRIRKRMTIDAPQRVERGVQHPLTAAEIMEIARKNGLTTIESARGRT